MDTQDPGQGYKAIPGSTHVFGDNPHGLAPEPPSQLTASVSACQNAWKLEERLRSGLMC